VLYGRENHHATEGAPFTGRQGRLDLELQLDDFIDAIERGMEPLNSFSEALANFRTLEAIERSLERGISVTPSNATAIQQTAQTNGE